MNTQELHLLSHGMFSTMLALSLQPRHGYELMQQVRSDSLERLQLGSGGLYATLKQLLQKNFIEEVPSERESDRRRLYRLTKKGWDQLRFELQYYQHVVELAKERKAL